MSGESASRKSIRIKDVMQPPVAVSPDVPVLEVLEILRNNSIPGVPVVDGEGHLVGFATDGDLLASAMPGYLALMEDVSFVSETSDRWIHYFTESTNRPVREVMNTEVASVELGISELEVAHKMLHDGVSSVVITRNGKVAGLVSRLNLYSAIVDSGS